MDSSGIDIVTSLGHTARATPDWSISEGATGVGDAAPGADFARALDDVTDNVGLSAATGDGSSASDVTQPGMAGWTDALQHWLADEQALAGTLSRAMETGAGDTRDLIRLQVLVAGTSLRIDTVTRVIDRCVGSLRQITQLQV